MKKIIKNEKKKKIIFLFSVYSFDGRRIPNVKPIVHYYERIVQM